MPNLHPYLLDAGVELRGGSGHGQVLLQPLRGHLDHLHEVRDALWRPRGLRGDLLQGLDGGEQVGLEDVGVGAVVDEVDLADVHDKVGGQRVITSRHGDREVLVVLEEVHEAGLHEDVEGVEVVPG